MSHQAAATYWACEPCHLSHAKCDRSATGEVPCPRCVRRGRADKCRLRPIRSRGPKAQTDATQPVAAQTQAHALHQADATADATPQHGQDSTLGGLFLSTSTQSQVDVVNPIDVAVPNHLPPFGVSHPPVNNTFPSTSSGEISYESSAYDSMDRRVSTATTDVAGGYGGHPAGPSAQTWVGHDIGRFDIAYSASFPFDDFSPSSTSRPPAADNMRNRPSAADGNVYTALAQTGVTPEYGVSGNHPGAFKQGSSSCTAPTAAPTPVLRSSSITPPHPAVHVNNYPFALDANVFDVFSTYNPQAVVGPPRIRTATAGVAPAPGDLHGRALPSNIMHEDLFNSWGSSFSTGSSTAEANHDIISQGKQATVFPETFLAEFEERGSILDSPRFSEAGSFNFTWNTEEPGRRNQQFDGLGSFEWNNAASASTDTPQNLDFMRHCGH